LKPKVVIIGAGAAGLIAAIRAAQKGAEVVVLEKKERAGTKLLITGKGRCNISNTDSLMAFISHIYPNGNFLRRSFDEFVSHDIVAMFHSFDVTTKTERGGRLFPVSDKSKDIVNALIGLALQLKMKLLYS